MGAPRFAFGMIVVILFAAPLVYFGEATVWGFSRPVSNLEWDEGGVGPQQAGGGGSGSTESPSSGGGSGAETSGGGGSGASDSGGTGGSGPTGGSGASGGSAASTSGGGSGGWLFGSLSVGDWTPRFSFAFAGFATSLFCFGACYFFWGHAMAAMFMAMAHALATMMLVFVWVLIAFALMVLWLYLGVLGGLVAGVGLAVAAYVYVHTAGVAVPPATQTPPPSQKPPQPPAFDARAKAERERRPKRPGER